MSVGIIAGIKTGIKTGPKVGIASGLWESGGGITVGTDGPNDVYVPVSDDDFDQLGITPPNSLWLCQEASGNLADSIGSLTLTANASPSYQQAVTGWTRTGLQFTQTTANQRVTATVGLGPLPTTTSSAWLCYVKILASPSSTRGILGVGNDTGVRMPALDKVRATCVGVHVDGTATYFADGNVHPVIAIYDRTAGTFTVRTDEEAVIGTYSASAADGQKGFGACAGAGSPAPMQLLWACMWSGANAEALDSAALLTTLGW